MRSSARPSRSAQSLSPVVSGRLTIASTHSSVPPGSNETAPETKLKRAARLGGSSLSAAKAEVARKLSANIAAKSTKFRAEYHEKDRAKYFAALCLMSRSLLKHRKFPGLFSRFEKLEGVRELFKP